MFHSMGLTTIVLALLLLLVPISIFAGDCEVVGFSVYEDLRSSGGHVSGSGHVNIDIYKTECAEFTIKNTAAGGRFDVKLYAETVNGRIITRTVRTSMIQPNETYSGSVCFGRIKGNIVNMACSW